MIPRPSSGSPWGKPLARPEHRKLDHQQWPPMASAPSERRNRITGSGHLWRQADRQLGRQPAAGTGPAIVLEPDHQQWPPMAPS
ncbi:hypothetical protein [Aeromonas veronii]|uniref:hypothetical protein n=1 Tax=Aeromonas veronii TaxID=654 RepID=UPI000E0934EE|nr:hypothetical protein [Aeromonas veronii]RDE61022.1 hypothetical protein DV708_17125 [Aeromonas veronii]